MSNNIISDDLQASFITDPLVLLYELDLNNTFDTSDSAYDRDTRVLKFHPGLDESLDEVKFHPIGQPAKNNTSEANTYIALPLVMDGIQQQSDGASARPTITIANVTDIFNSALDDVENFKVEDLVGQRVTRRRTFANYIVGGADAANPYELPVQTYVVERIADRNSTSITLELSVPFDLTNVQLPGRVVIGKYCPWIYQGEALNLGGGCRWLTSSTITYKDKLHTIFVNKDDKRFYPDSLLTAESSAYSDSTTYSQDDIVSYNNKYYQAILGSNTDQNPITTLDTYWEEVLEYTTYSSSKTDYSVGDFVLYSNNIWNAAISGANNNVNVAPQSGSAYWTRADLCSKTLTGCKKRYQAVPTSDALNKPISHTLKTDRILPFGGFPGSAKFS